MIHHEASGSRQSNRPHRRGSFAFSSLLGCWRACRLTALRKGEAAVREASVGSYCLRIDLALNKCNFLVRGRKKWNLPVKSGPADVARLSKGLERCFFCQREEASFERRGC